MCSRQAAGIAGRGRVPGIFHWLGGCGRGRRTPFLSQAALGRTSGRAHARNRRRPEAGDHAAARRGRHRPGRSCIYPDQERLQRAVDRAIERRDVALFTPVGEARIVALTTLRLSVEAIASDRTELAGAILVTAQPAPADDSVASAAPSGVALDLLDTILSARHPESRAGLGGKVRPPEGPLGR